MLERAGFADIDVRGGYADEQLTAEHDFLVYIARTCPSGNIPRTPCQSTSRRVIRASGAVRRSLLALFSGGTSSTVTWLVGHRIGVACRSSHWGSRACWRTVIAWWLLPPAVIGLLALSFQRAIRVA